MCLGGLTYSTLTAHRGDKSLRISDENVHALAASTSENQGYVMIGDP
jgi:hypothetical protein